MSEQRFVELMPRALVPLCGYLHTRKGHCTGITFVDSTPIAVCHNKRSSRNQVLGGYATRGKSSMGWYFGFKLHLMINDEGELLAFRVTRGEVDDREPVWQMAQDLFGDLYGDRGYISKALHDDLLANGLKLITLIRRNMKPRLMRLWDRLMLRKRFLIEQINRELTSDLGMGEHQVRQDEGRIEKSFGIAVLAYLFLIRVCRDELRSGQSWRVAHLQHVFRLRVITNQVEHNVKAKFGRRHKAA